VNFLFKLEKIFLKFKNFPDILVDKNLFFEKICFQNYLFLVIWFLLFVDFLYVIVTY